MSPEHIVVALFANRADADRGMARLLTAGCTPEQISLFELAGGSGGRIGVSAEVAGADRGTIAASVLLASRALEVECLVPGRAEAAA